MESIFDCAEYTRNGTRSVPYFCDYARYGRPEDTIIFWFMRTPTGRVSKYWSTLRIPYNYSTEGKRKCVEKHERNYLDYGIGTRRLLRRGYSWSKAYLCSGSANME